MSRLEKIAGVGLALIILGAVLAGFWVWQQRQLESRLQNIGELVVEMTPAPLVTEGESTFGLSVRSFGLTHQKATDWREDALLVMGVNSWPELNDPADLTSARGDGWQYTYYSPSSNRATTFGVNGSQVSQGPEHPTGGQPLNPRPLSEWRLDDAEAVAIFLANGGNDFLEAEESVYMTMQLSMVEDHSRVQWLIAAVSVPTSHSLTMWIDAQSGDIIDTLLVQ